MSQKIVSLRQASKIAKESQQRGNKVGLITGCFDILHKGHIELFQFARQYVDILIVGVEPDSTIRKMKGLTRPKNHLSQRCQTLEKCKDIHYLFSIKQIPRASKIQIDLMDILTKILLAVSPDYLITNSNADTSWEIKKEIVAQTVTEMILDTRPRVTSSTSIIEKDFKSKHIIAFK